MTYLYNLSPPPENIATTPTKYTLFTLLDVCLSSLRRGHAKILSMLTDDPRRESAYNIYIYINISAILLICQLHLAIRAGVTIIAFDLLQ